MSDERGRSNVMCYMNSAALGEAQARFLRGEPYYQLRHKQESSGWIVASEPLDSDPAWKTLCHGQILVTDGVSGTFSCY